MRRLVIGILVCVVGCGGAGPDEDAESTESAARVTPNGDEKMGHLVFQEPEWPQGVSKAGYTVRYGRVSMKAGEPLRVKTGEACIELTAMPDRLCGIKIVENQTTTVVLSAVRLFSNGAKTRTDMSGLTGGFTLRRKLAERNWPTVKRAAEQWKDEYHLVFPGRYMAHLSLEPLNSAMHMVKGGVEPGKLWDIDVTPPDRRAILRFKPSQRELPYRGPSCNDIRVNGSRNDVRWGSWQYNSPLNADMDVIVFGGEDIRYDVTLSGTTAKVVATPGGTVEIPIQRLDIDDVRVEDETGAVTIRPGTYTIFVQEAGGAFAPVQGACGTGNTGTGIDVLSGVYKVVVDYTTALGKKKYETIVTL